MVEKFDLKELADALDIERDELFVYAGLSTFLDRYAIKDKDKKPTETPQYFFMRVAMGLSYNEKNPTLWAKRFYDKMSRLEYHRRRFDEPRRGHDAPDAFELLPHADARRHGAHREIRRATS